MIDYESELPAYRQIAQAIRVRIESGQYRRRLPTVTHLEQEFGVARNTVLQAMAHLRDLNLIHTVRNRGSFVRATEVTVVAPEPGMRITARMPTEAEREELALDELVPVLMVERGDQVEVLPADSSEIRIPE
ncbi:winged helix-turn-helix domain-containing protein [Streptosporangium sp. NBC_01755]|uniref:GntR family transcriptional regulator n=1 Tax=Streptosporangium sp. NBC_01755 TaxID=2975949 RepID=UPI002DDA3B4B|nr:winged helix-turn-helix domain-containing protein [Streptosporangium sp. NBC_01755]WSD03196.1 winged helix-turn-helix domain-containing protein [Streptosporangium sp. NBC_01755]